MFCLGLIRPLLLLNIFLSDENFLDAKIQITDTRYFDSGYTYHFAFYIVEFVSCFKVRKKEFYKIKNRQIDSLLKLFASTTHSIVT